MGIRNRIIDPVQFELTLNRLAYQLIEEHDDFAQTALIGIQPRGVHLASRLSDIIENVTGRNDIRKGQLDITFFRDDLRQRQSLPQASVTKLPFLVEDLRVVLIDDVLFTGRTIRAALDALLAHGRPRSVELAVLIDRRFSRELPIQPKYVGRSVDILSDQKVRVRWAHDENGDGHDHVELTSISSEND
jgi:pyrimidine operon attenuation protein/uracil phosphoribosyltransferase|tara:strand:+ start:161 stop:727 length:567 start_codon:yes stop_codon:yes gene_type:complete